MRNSSTIWLTLCLCLDARLALSTPFTCPAGQIIFQQANGKLVCIAPDANPCPAGQVLEKPASSLGAATCKPLPRAPFTCPPGQVAVQQPTGKFVCVASP